MFAKSFSSLIVAASLAVSSLGLAATPSTAAGTTPAVTPVTKSVKIRHTRRPGSVSKVTSPSASPSTKAATPAVAPTVQPRTPAKATTPKAVRSSKVARPGVKSATTSAKPAVR